MPSHINPYSRNCSHSHVYKLIAGRNFPGYSSFFTDDAGFPGWKKTQASQWYWKWHIIPGGLEYQFTKYEIHLYFPYGIVLCSMLRKPHCICICDTYFVLVYDVIIDNSDSYQHVAWHIIFSWEDLKSLFSFGNYAITLLIYLYHLTVSMFPSHLNTVVLIWHSLGILMFLTNTRFSLSFFLLWVLNHCMSFCD